jgi:hypothetical protein
MTVRSIAWHVLGLSIMATAAHAQTPHYAPCSLLTTEDVRRVFPDTKAGEPDRRNEKAGIFSCVWSHQGGILQIVTGEEEQTPAEEARSWVDAFADPLNQSAAGRVRFEKVAGVGDGAIAVVESADKAKGFIQGGAYIVVRRGKQQFTILAPGLAQRERSAALATLTELGRAAAARLK